MEIGVWVGKMTEPTLFELPPTEERVTCSRRPVPRRLACSSQNRQQLQFLPRDLDAALAEDHSARAIWGLLEKLDLSAFYGSIKATLDRPGRPTTDPKVLLALWLLGTVEGIGSARKLARLCQEHDAYRWLSGGVPINYHMLSDFRVAHEGALDELLTQIAASLMAAGAVTLERVSQDGMRVRASAGASSFRRQETLEKHLEEARAQVARLAQEREHPDPGVGQRSRAARERAARERVERVEQALRYLPQAQAAKERQQQTQTIARRAKVTQPRTSTTDPQARVMKMPDGGFRPAYNVELATDQAKGIIVGVRVVMEGTDAGQAPPMEEQVKERTGQHPRGLPDGRRFCHPGGYHRPGGTGRHSVRPCEAAQEQTGGRAVPAPLRRYPPSGTVASAYGHGGSQGCVQATRLHRRMGQCPSDPTRGCPGSQSAGWQSSPR